MRTHGTDRSGRSFSAITVQAVWDKALPAPGVDPTQRRKDACGAWIDRAQYGNTTPRGMGWEVDHLVPVSLGGGDDLANLQPLQWQNNRGKGDAYPNWTCQIAATK
ncbi:MAG: HNH endonuclease [Chloroflexi bacterium]|nr:HNH endonuclease [Chloroflexota bacterium]